jgi:hypothetical protein
VEEAAQSVFERLEAVLPRLASTLRDNVEQSPGK